MSFASVGESLETLHAPGGTVEVEVGVKTFGSEESAELIGTGVDSNEAREALSEAASSAARAKAGLAKMSANSARANKKPLKNSLTGFIKPLFLITLKI
jgi:hypothetical protein